MSAILHLARGERDPFHLLWGHDDSQGHIDVDCGPGQIVWGDGYSGQLKDLKLQDLYYQTSDLGVATCLTSTSLSNKSSLLCVLS